MREKAVEQALVKAVKAAGGIAPKLTSSGFDSMPDCLVFLSDGLSKEGRPLYQILLEKRYLCFLTWEQIAVDMGYNVRHLYRIHEEALEKVQVPATRH